WPPRPRSPGISSTYASGTKRALGAEIASRPPPAAHPGNDARPARAIFRREPRGAFAHVPRARVLVGVRHRIGRRVRPVGIGGGHANSRAGARGLRTRRRRDPGGGWLVRGGLRPWTRRWHGRALDDDDGCCCPYHLCPRPLRRPTLAHRRAAVNVGARCAIADVRQDGDALAAHRRSPKTSAMADPLFADPLAWRSVKAPSLEEL